MRNGFPFHVERDGGALVWVALREIKAGERLTASYSSVVPQVQSVWERRQLMSAQFGFACGCERCVLEEATTPKPEEFLVEVPLAMADELESSESAETAAQAASALRPLAGDFAFILFATGILGVGLIGVPVLAGSAAYALAEAMGWQQGLELKASDARGFYGVIAASVLAGLAIQYLPINPMKALFWSAVINGVVAVPLMVVVILLASSKSVMGPFTSGRPIIVLGWIATAVMAGASIMILFPG